MPPSRPREDTQGHGHRGLALAQGVARLPVGCRASMSGSSCKPGQGSRCGAGVLVQTGQGGSGEKLRDVQGPRRSPQHGELPSQVRGRPASSKWP